MLLELLEADEAAFEETFALLDRLDQRIVITATVADEVRRLGPIKIKEAVNATVSHIRTVTHQIPTIQGRIGSGRHAVARERIVAAYHELERDLSDQVRTRNERILDLIKRRGLQHLSADVRSEVLSTAPRRVELKVPPGYTDAGKTREDVRFNDLLIWRETIEVALTRQRAVFFVTNERKSDWWIVNADQHLVGSRPELREEMFAQSGQRFALMHGGCFVMQYGEAERITSYVQMPPAAMLQFLENARRSGASFTRLLPSVTTINKQVAAMNAALGRTLLYGFSDLSKSIRLPYAETFAGMEALNRSILNATRYTIAPGVLLPMFDANAAFGKIMLQHTRMNDEINHNIAKIVNVQTPNLFAGLNIGKSFTDVAPGLVGSSYSALSKINGTIDIARWLDPHNSTIQSMINMIHDNQAAINAGRAVYEAMQRANDALGNLDENVVTLISPPEPTPTSVHWRTLSQMRRLRTIRRRRAHRRLRGKRLNLLDPEIVGTDRRLFSR